MLEKTLRTVMYVSFVQSVSLSCYAGQVMSRRVPFKNAGNIPLRVKLKVSGSQSKVFTVSPDFLLMEPGEVGSY